MSPLLFRTFSSSPIRSKSFLSPLIGGISVYLLALAAIVIVTWPWVKHFKGAFLFHWDPPFHAWKLEFMARRILAGDIFMSSPDTNMLYPHSGALYYEALQWPPALFASLLFGCTDMPSELVYHITLLAFWALSAPCMYFFLRQLQCSKSASTAGAIIFCILPHRISYMVEFQMEMIFAMPLFFAFVYRFFCKNKICDAALAAFCWWLFAVSELYQAVFAALAVPFIALSFLTLKPRCLATKKFWISSLVGLGAGIASLFVMLTPYLQQRNAGAVIRPIEEVARHAAQPFSFLVPFGKFSFWTLDAKVDEFSLYPTIIILFLSALAFIVWLGKQFPSSAEATGSRSRLNVLSALAMTGAGVLFYLLCILLQCKVFHGVKPVAVKCWDIAGVIFVCCALLCALTHATGESERSAMMRGLLASGVLFLFLSFGPRLSLGMFYGIIASTQNTVYHFCNNFLIPFISSFRVVSRFSIYILFGLICAASLMIDIITCYAKKGNNKHIQIIISSIFVIFVALEAIPPKYIKTINNIAPSFSVKMIPSNSQLPQKLRSYFTCYRSVDNQQDYPSIQRLFVSKNNHTLFVSPIGNRFQESMRMFSLLKNDFFYVYAWGGFFPEFSINLHNLDKNKNMKDLYNELIKFYPSCLLIIDRNDFFFSHDRLNLYKKIAYEVDGDNRFTILKLKSATTSSVKIFRSDIAYINNIIKLSVRSTPHSRLSFFLNKRNIGELTVPDSGIVQATLDITGVELEKMHLNTFTVRSHESSSPICITDFEMIPRN